jgi:hypothetical protein
MKQHFSTVISVTIAALMMMMMMIMMSIMMKIITIIITQSVSFFAIMLKPATSATHLSSLPSQQMINRTGQ